MPTLYTSLRAHYTKDQTFAPKNQRPPVPAAAQELSDKEHQAHIHGHYSHILDTLVASLPPAPSIAVIGAGLAGLSAAYELRTRGYRVTVFEASDCPGGRTWTNHDLVQHHLMERGAELIGSNHPLWLHYAGVFHLHFSNVKDYRTAPIVLGKSVLSTQAAKTLYQEMDEAFGFISARSKMIIDAFRPWTDPSAEALDAQSVHHFVRHTNWSKRCREAVEQQLEADNGVPIQDQSLLGLLAMVKGGGMDRYWIDTEVYRCRRGAQGLALAFASALKGLDTPILYKDPVTRIDTTDEEVKVQTKSGKSSQFHDVILAVPPSAWFRISCQPADLASLLAGPPQMGRNTKTLLVFGRRFWQKEGRAPSSTQPGPVDETWETTEDYSKPEYGMVGFAGASHADLLSKKSDQQAIAASLACLQRTYEGIQGQILRDNSGNFRAEFENWPKRDWAWASYSFPNCGDVVKWGPVFDLGFCGKFHFAGEHTCYAFTGYMEGALQSGYRLARKLAARDRVPWAQNVPPLSPPKRP